MKQGTTSKLKFKKLRRTLGDPPLYQVIGLLESLWQFTATDAPLGDVGKFSNDDIATAVEWPGDPNELVAALIKTEWLDISDDFRLVVHHWHEHCPDYLRKRVQRRGVSFASEQNSELRPENPQAADGGSQRQTSADGGSQRLPTEPSQAESEPSQAKPSRARACRKPARGGGGRSQPAPPGGSESGFQKKPDSDSGCSEEAARQIQALAMRNATERIAKQLRVTPPEDHPEASRRRKQSLGDLVTISKAVEHCRGDPAAIETLERLAAEVAEGKMIKKPVAAWIKRLKDADLFYK